MSGYSKPRYVLTARMRNAPQKTYMLCCELHQSPALHITGAVCRTSPKIQTLPSATVHVGGPNSDDAVVAAVIQFAVVGEGDKAV